LFRVSSHAIPAVRRVWQSCPNLNTSEENTMLMHMLTHIPLFVWAILAFLIVRGIMATREREANLRKLFVIPAVMLVMALQDIAMRFDLHGSALGAWGAGVLAMALPIWVA